MPPRASTGEFRQRLEAIRNLRRINQLGRNFRPGVHLKFRLANAEEAEKAEREIELVDDDECDVSEAESSVTDSGGFQEPNEDAETEKGAEEETETSVLEDLHAGLEALRVELFGRKSGPTSSVEVKAEGRKDPEQMWRKVVKRMEKTGWEEMKKGEKKTEKEAVIPIIHPLALCRPPSDTC